MPERRTQRLQMHSPAPAFMDGARRRPSMASLRSPRSGWRRSLSPTANVRCACGWRGHTPWQTNGGPAFSEDQRRAADYLLVTKHGFPAYMAGAFSSARARRLIGAGFEKIRDFAQSREQQCQNP